MPSERPQFNVRLSEDGAARFKRLEKKAPGAVGAPLTKAQIIEMALTALEEKLATCEKKEKK
jgi:hypothetical protein